MELSHQELLNEYGSWMQALYLGRLTPFTEGQRRFVRVVHGDEQPTTPFEIAWCEFLKYRVQERQRLVDLACRGDLGYDQVRTLLDIQIQIGFSDEQVAELQRRLRELVTSRAPTVEHSVRFDVVDPRFLKALELRANDDIPDL